MPYNLTNISNSSVYGEYKKVYDSSQINFTDHSPYSMFNQFLTFKTFKNFAIDNIDNSKNTFYRNSLPYFFKTWICSDEESEINNNGKKGSELKVPLLHFINGKLFGINKRFECIKNGIVLDSKTYDGWNFPKFFDLFPAPVDKSNTNDVDVISEYIYYITFFDYFNFQKYYGFEVIKNSDLQPYSNKGKIIIEKNSEKYQPGFGEAPNFLDISVNSFQKIKNKASITAKAVRTNYDSVIAPDKQIIIKDINEELLSAFKFIHNDAKIIKKFEDELIISSLADNNLEIIIKFIQNIAEYFNLVHFILKSSIINYEFIKQCSASPDTDIFQLNDLTKKDVAKANLIKSIAENKEYKEDPLIKQFGFYCKQIIVNLLNIAGSNEDTENTINLFLDLLETNNPEIIGKYNRNDLKNISLIINNAVFETFKIINPQQNNISTAKKNKISPSILKYDIPLQPIHSNDLILEKLYVYKSLERPLSYDQILQEENLYKILDFESANLLIDVEKNIKQKRTIDDSITLLENVLPNTKYYYCFLSQREYDAYSEVFNKKSLSIKDKKIVEHFSSPTKILELEMISTENSTYLDYNFFVPKQKRNIVKSKNFSKKIKIYPSDIQTDPTLYNEFTENFQQVKGLFPFWTKVDKMVNSNDFDTGKTIKLRITSPKTNKRVDLNFRHFVKLDKGYGFDFKEVISEDFKKLFSNKKYKEVVSKLQPTVILDFYTKTQQKQEKIDTKAYPNLKIEKNKNGYYVTKNFEEIILEPIIENGFNEFIIGKDGNYKTLDISIIYKQGFKESKQTISSKPDLNKYFSPKFWAPIKIGDYINTSNVDFPYNNIIISQSFTDSYGFNYSNGISLFAVDQTPQFNISATPQFNIPNLPTSINEGEKITVFFSSTFSANKTFNWNIEQLKNYSLKNFEGNTNGSLKPNLDAQILDFNIKTLQDEADATGSQSFVIVIRDANGDIVVSSAPIIVNDTSKLAQYKIFANTSVVEEGKSVTFTIEPTNAKEGATIYWKVVSDNGFGVSDTNLTTLDGTKTISNNQSVQVTIPVLKDNILSEAETFKLEVRRKQTDLVPAASSISIIVTDTTPNEFIPSDMIGSQINPFLTFEDFQSQASALSTKFKYIFYVDSATRDLVQAEYNINGNYVTSYNKGPSGIVGSKNNPYISFAQYSANYSAFTKKYRDTYFVDESNILRLARFDYKNTGNYISDLNTYPDKTNIAQNPFPQAVINKNLTKNPGLRKPANDAKNVSTNTETMNHPWQYVVVGSTDTNTLGIYPYSDFQYTSDSNWGAAAVHAGLINPGEKAIIDFEGKGALKIPGNIGTKNGVVPSTWQGDWDVFRIRLVRKIP